MIQIKSIAPSLELYQDIINRLEKHIKDNCFTEKGLMQISGLEYKDKCEYLQHFEIEILYRSSGSIYIITNMLFIDINGRAVNLNEENCPENFYHWRKI